MWIDLNAEESKPVIHKEKDVNGNETSKERITILAFELYGKKVGDGNGREIITTHAYKVRMSPKSAEMIKNLIYKISNEGNTNVRFISNVIYAVSKEETMRNIILQHNISLKNMVIVPIVNIKDKDEDKVKKMLVILFIYQVGNLQDKQQEKNIYSSLINVSPIALKRKCTIYWESTTEPY